MACPLWCASSLPLSLSLSLSLSVFLCLSVPLNLALLVSLTALSALLLWFEGSGCPFSALVRMLSFTLGLHLRCAVNSASVLCGGWRVALCCIGHVRTES